MTGLKGQAGFTLLEMVLACSLVLTITLAVLPLIWQTKAIVQQGQIQIELDKSLQIGMEKMTSELLTCDSLNFTDNYAGYQPSADDKRLCFRMRGTNVRYYVDSSGQLLRTFTGDKGSTALPINQHIKGLAVEYFGNHGQPISPGTAPKEVVRVQITLTAELKGRTDSLTSSVTLRVPPAGRR